MKDVYERVLDYGTELLRKNKDISNKAIVFDFDDTLVNTRIGSPSFVIGVGMLEFYERIPEMVTFLKRAKTMGYAIFIITARPPGSEFIVYQNIHEKIPEILPLIDNIFASPIPLSGNLEAFKRFKAILRRNLQFIDLMHANTITSKQLYELELRTPFKEKDTLNIVLTIGDQPQDISNMSLYGILLPRPERDPNHAYVFMPHNPDYDICIEKI